MVILFTGEFHVIDLGRVHPTVHSTISKSALDNKEIGSNLIDNEIQKGNYIIMDQNNLQLSATWHCIKIKWQTDTLWQCSIC